MLVVSVVVVVMVVVVVCVKIILTSGFRSRSSGRGRRSMMIRCVVVCLSCEVLVVELFVRVLGPMLMQCGLALLTISGV